VGLFSRNETFPVWLASFPQPQATSSHSFRSTGLVSLVIRWMQRSLYGFGVIVRLRGFSSLVVGSQINFPVVTSAGVEVPSLLALAPDHLFGNKTRYCTNQSDRIFYSSKRTPDWGSKKRARQTIIDIVGSSDTTMTTPDQEAILAPLRVSVKEQVSDLSFE